MSSPTADEKIGPTAHYTAYVWHRLGFPNAQVFVTPLGRTLFWSFRFAGEGLMTFLPSVPSMTQYLEYRHRAFESVVEDEGPDVVVELGAGLSRRGVTWASRGVRYIEIDLPHMVAQKQRIIQDRGGRALREAIAGKLEHVSIDILAEDFPDALARLIADAKRPLVMTEGVLGYFEKERRARLVRSVSEALDGRGAFVGELRARQSPSLANAAVHALRGGIRLVTAGRGAGEDPATHEEARAFFVDSGFSSVEPIEPARFAHLAHIPFPARVWVCR